MKIGDFCKYRIDEEWRVGIILAWSTDSDGNGYIIPVAIIYVEHIKFSKEL